MTLYSIHRQAGGAIYSDISLIYEIITCVQMRFPVLTCVLHATYISVEKKIPKKRAVNLQLRIASCYGSVAFMSVCWMAEQVVLPVGLRPGISEAVEWVRRQTERFSFALVLLSHPLLEAFLLSDSESLWEDPLRSKKSRG